MRVFFFPFLFRGFRVEEVGDRVLDTALFPRSLISKFFDEISQDTGKIVFGVADTLACQEMGAVETLIVWDQLDADR